MIFTQIRGCDYLDERFTSKLKIIDAPFNECIKHMMEKLRINHKHVFMSFAVDNDLRFLYTTDQAQDEKYFKRDPLTYPEDFPIPIVCAQRLLLERCPKTTKNQILTGGQRGLRDYLKALCDRDQHHLAIHDTIDLFDVLQAAYGLDREDFEIPRTTYMYTKERMKNQTKTT